MTTKVIIDTDPGVDDAVALFVALASQDLDILGITTVNGNVSVQKGTVNARRICEYCWHSGIKVFQGSDKPLKRSVLNCEWVHGEDGLAGAPFPAPTSEAEKEHAVDFIIDTLKASAGKEVTLVTLGPLTNIATAFLREPDIIRKVREIVMMGGAFSDEGPRGNATNWAEFNILADPHAAKVVFSEAEQITVVPMEVGMQVTATKDYINRLRDIRTRSADISADIIKTVEDFVLAKWPEQAVDGIALYDPTAMTCLLKSGLFSGRYGSVDVNTDSSDEKFGMTTFLDGDEKRNCLVMHKADGESVLNFIAESLAALP